MKDGPHRPPLGSDMIVTLQRNSSLLPRVLLPTTTTTTWVRSPNSDYAYNISSMGTEESTNMELAPEELAPQHHQPVWAAMYLLLASLDTPVVCFFLYCPTHHHHDNFTIPPSGVGIHFDAVFFPSLFVIHTALSRLGISLGGGGKRGWSLAWRVFFLEPAHWRLVGESPARGGPLMPCYISCNSGSGTACALQGGRVFCGIQR